MAGSDATAPVGRKLAACAVSARRSRGRQYPEPAPAYRDEFQRDRDRVVHCAAFRRLEYKTQVFVNHEGDMFRTRLTHSLEVAQISRTVARALGLNEDLVEAIALAHDLGHTPFGHAGQDALNECMRDHGGFEHNLQSLRIVDRLEERYAEFSGLNLMFETREGILKHCNRRHAAALGELGRRFLDGTWPSLEAQVTNIADEIAYNSHDVDDGLRSGLLSIEQLRTVDLAAAALGAVRDAYGSLDDKRTAAEMIRRIIDAQVTDLIESSRARLATAAPADVDAVRGAGAALIGFAPAMSARHQALKRFLRTNLYEHPRVGAMMHQARQVVHGLFAVYHHRPQLLPARARGAAHATLARRIADYIAGMTDRFAIAEYRRLVGPVAMG